MAKQLQTNGKKEIPHGLWTKCKKCEQIIYNKELNQNLKICPKCGYYFRLGGYERIEQLVEPGSFKEIDKNMRPSDPLHFPDYAKKSKSAKLPEAVVIGEGKIGTHDVVIAVMDFAYMGGSMGSVVGEKVTKAAELALSKKVPLIVASSSGGARMQEGIISLMQMAKTSAALAKLSESNIPYISLLTDPTTGGVAASYSMLGDVNIAEPNALIGFAGPRVIEQTIRQQLPKGFQMSEFVLDHGMIDLIVERKELKSTLNKILNFFI